jgi:hypothetical protein
LPREEWNRVTPSSSTGPLPPFADKQAHQQVGFVLGREPADSARPRVNRAEIVILDRFARKLKNPAESRDSVPAGFLGNRAVLIGRGLRFFDKPNALAHFQDAFLAKIGNGRNARKPLQRGFGNAVGIEQRAVKDVAQDVRKIARRHRERNDFLRRHAHEPMPARLKAGAGNVAQFREKVGPRNLRRLAAAQPVQQRRGQRLAAGVALVA